MATESRRARVAGVQTPAEEIARIRLTFEPGQEMPFRAGQWTILQAKDGDRILKRCFSIASAPSDRDGLTYYVERTWAGPVSFWASLPSGFMVNRSPSGLT